MAIDGGSVSVDVLPDMRRFTSELRAKLKSVRPVSINVAPNMSGFNRELKAKLKVLPPVKVNVTPDASLFSKELKAKLKVLPPVKVNVTPDASLFASELKAKLKALPPVKVNVIPDITGFMTDLRAKLKALGAVKVRIVADVTAFLADLRAKLRALPPVRVRVAVDLDSAAASGRLAALTRNRTVHLGVDVRGGAEGGIRTLTSAIIALGAAAVPVVAVLGGIALAVAGPLAAAGAGVLALGASVVGNITRVVTAQKDLETAQTAATAAAQTYAAAQSAVQNALDGLASSERGLTDAQIQASRAVETARTSLANTIRSANQSIRSAEDAVTSAQVRATDAQEALNAARDAARQRLADYASQLQGARLAESGSQLGVQSAREALNNLLGDPGATQLQIDLARQALAEAQFGLEESKKRRAELRKQAAEDRRQGIRGDEAVVEAQQALVDATRRVREAERDLVQTKVQAAREIAAAQKDVVRAQVDGARAIAAAQAGVSSAQRHLGEAQSAAARAGGALAKAQDDVAAAMGKLDGPAAVFAAALDTARSSWNRFLDLTETSSLGLATDALELFSRLMPKVAPLVNVAADAVGDLFDDFGRFVDGKDADGVLDWLTAATGPAIRSIGRIFGNIAIGIGGMVAASKPLGDSVLSSFEDLTEQFRDFGQSDGFLDFLDYVRRVGPDVAHFFGELLDTVAHLGKALAPLGGFILGALTVLFEMIQQVPVDVLTAAAAALVTMLVAVKGIGIVAAIVAAGPIALIVIGIGLLIGALVLAYQRSDTFREIVNHAFAKAGAAIKKFWKTDVSPALHAMAKFFREELIPVISWLWKNVVRPYYGAMGRLIAFTWSKVIRPALKAWWAYITTFLWPTIERLWKWVVKPAFEGIGWAIRTAWINVIRPVFRALRGFIVDHLVPAFKTAADKITDFWDTLKEAAREPARFVIETIYNDGLRKMIGALPGVDTPKSIKPGFATGGWTGPGPRMKTAGIVHADEFVLSKPARQSLEAARPGMLDRLNATGQWPGFFLGGKVPLPGATSVVQHSPAKYPWATWAGDLNKPNDAGAPIVSWKDGFVAGMHFLGDRSYGRYATINHDGTSTLYAHMSRFASGLAPGSPVKAGQTVGYVGDIGNADGTHLHFELKGGGAPIGTSGNLGGSSGGGGDWLDAIKTIKNVVGDVPGWMKKLNGMGGWGGVYSTSMRSSGNSAIGWMNDKIPNRFLPDNPIPKIFDTGGALMPGELAYNASRKPEAVSTIPQFRELVGAGRPSGRVALTITNWREGTGYFEEIADDRVDSARSLDDERTGATWSRPRQ